MMEEHFGSMENEECRIDSISQSWSVISKVGDNDKKYISMESLENHLIDKENGIIKLLDPPFEKGNLEPGYIKAYLPGVRENGGQYTHECCCYNQFLKILILLKYIYYEKVPQTEKNCNRKTK